MDLKTIVVSGIKAHHGNPKLLCKFTNDAVSDSIVVVRSEKFLLFLVLVTIIGDGDVDIIPIFDLGTIVALFDEALDRLRNWRIMEVAFFFTVR